MPGVQPAVVGVAALGSASQLGHVRTIPPATGTADAPVGPILNGRQVAALFPYVFAAARADCTTPAWYSRPGARPASSVGRR